MNARAQLILGASMARSEEKEDEWEDGNREPTTLKQGMSGR